LDSLGLLGWVIPHEPDELVKTGDRA